MIRLRPRMAAYYSLCLLVCLFVGGLDLCASLNDEGRALLRFKERVEVDPHGALANWVEVEDDPCSWFGVGCSDDGRVIALNLKDLLLEGRIAPELGMLIHLESLVLQNNSFCGSIPKEIGKLQKLEILDLSHNNISGPFLSEVESILSLKILVLRGNRYIGYIPPELRRLCVLSELLADEEQSSLNNHSVLRWSHNAMIRKLLQEKANARPVSMAPASAPSPSPSPSSSPLPMAPSLLRQFKMSSFAPPPSSKSVSSRPQVIASRYIQKSAPPLNAEQVDPPSEKKHTTLLIVLLSVAATSLFLAVLSSIYCFCYRENKVVSVMPWKTGLSGQLQKAFVTGVPSLRRSELESACEDFSNVVGSLSDYYLYKGTLSSGVEIAVTSTMVSSAKDWTDDHEVQFRNKISVLSKVNHKNFVNLIGFCEEEVPFTRMMVYEYAPNGTLFEHLHIKEADHLDWTARLRIIMGIAYCLEHMHELDSPVLQNLNSSSIYLCEDYAAKISDLSFWNEEKEDEQSFETSGVLDTQLATREGNVYKFGIILLEIISGRLPFSEDDGLLVLWASSHLTGKRPLMDMVDTTLESFSEEHVTAFSEIIKACIKPDPKKRPTMKDLVSLLRQITGLPPDAASPKLSPLWWAELEIISTDGNNLH